MRFFQAPLIQIDSSYYGKLTIAPWNIVKYNIFTSHGPNLYGTSPWYFYVLNGILNFNITFCIAFITPLLLVRVCVLGLSLLIITNVYTISNAIY